MEQYLEDAPSSFDIRKRKLNLPVDTTRPKQSWIKTFDAVGC